jgi:toxin ParE1/3/4
MARVVIAAPARRDLRRIRDYIEQDSPSFAARMVETILTGIDQLEAFPSSGRVVPELEDIAIREIVVRRYRVIYRVRSNTVRVVMVLHSARLLDTEELRSRL